MASAAAVLEGRALESWISTWECNHSIPGIGQGQLKCFVGEGWHTWRAYLPQSLP